MSTLGPDAVVGRPVWRIGVADATPVILALAPIGLVAGAIGAAAGGRLAGWAAGPLLVSGTAHFAMLAMTTAGPIGTAAVGVVVSLRSLIYSASLAPDFVEQPRWFRAFASYLLIDQVFALVEDRRPLLTDRVRYRRYYVALALPIYGSWLVAMALGAFGGVLVPAGMRLELAIVALVVAMLRPALTTPAARAAAFAAGLATIAGAALPHGTGLVIGAVLGMVAGARVGAGGAA